MSRLASKLSRWARSLKKYRCTDVKDSDVWLDRHVHPPGHDNAMQVGMSPATRDDICFVCFTDLHLLLVLKMKKKKVVDHDAAPPPKPKDAALTGWIGKETSLAAKAGPVVIDPDDELEVIEEVISDPVTHSGSSGSSSIAAPDEVVDEENEPRELS